MDSGALCVGIFPLREGDHVLTGGTVLNTLDVVATQVALAIWGDDVERIQYRATRQNVIPFAQRKDPDAERPGIQYSPSGWRGLITVEGQNDDAFAKVFRKQYERMSK